MNSSPSDADRAEHLRRAFEIAANGLLAERSFAGVQSDHWTGQLSTSALSTATAVSALSIVCRELRKQNRSSISSYSLEQLDSLIQRGCRWLQLHQNADGGFGDTDRSHSNIATTLLVLAAWKLADYKPAIGLLTDRANAFVESLGKWDGLRRRYGKDKTFVVPILTNCALAGLVSWSQVPSLPFELAALPQAWYRWAQMPVVSYAVPALVAMGQARFLHRTPWNPVSYVVRNACIDSTRRVLLRMQPDSGGYLEAVPLTSFVLMSLASIDAVDHPVSVNAVCFIVDSVLADGSWPIDTNLATWTTSLSILALSKSSSPTALEDQAHESDCHLGQVSDEAIKWLLRCQHRVRHPFTGADPGGWGWTDLSGAVPDADDTPAALLALHAWLSHATRRQRNDDAFLHLRSQVLESVAMGSRWLLNLQNRDGGWPTFCKGWGKLPFDRSGTDLTAHALRALHVWSPILNDSSEFDAKLQIPNWSARWLRARSRGLAYIERMQRDDGSWLPLWFGNQDDPCEDNPVYGTGRVLLAAADLGLTETVWARRGLQYLVQNQNDDGGWGGGESVIYRQHPHEKGSTIEETSVALEAMLAVGGNNSVQPSIMRGLNWLTAAIDRGDLKTSWPIGFYFAKLWYHERLYPWIFSLSALGWAKRRGFF